MFMGARGGLWVVMNAYKHSWVWPHAAMSTNEGPWPLLSTNEHLKATMSHHKHDAMAQTAFMSADKHSWELHYGAHTTHSAFAQDLTVLMRPHDCSWVLLNAHESSWVPMSTHECQWTLRRAHECWWVIQSDLVLDSLQNKKCQLFKRVPCSILTIS